MLDRVQDNNNSYRYKGYVNWGDNGSNIAESHTDCSGFINSLLKKGYFEVYNRLVDASKRGKPRAEDYFAFIKREDGFEKINNLNNLMAGDIIAIKYYNNDGPDTGHVMLADGRGWINFSVSDPIITNTLQWHIPIIDSSKSPHGTSDSRFQSGIKKNGLGRGILRIYTNKDNSTMGYTWSTSSTSKFWDDGDRPLVIGRLKY